MRSEPPSKDVNSRHHKHFINTLTHCHNNMKQLTIIFSALIVLSSCNTPAENTPTAYQLPPEILEIPIGTQYGLRAAEIVLPDLNGNEIALSSPATS